MLNVLIESADGLLVWQNDVGLVGWVRTYFFREFTFGRITVSASSLLIGAIVLTLTVVASRVITKLIERRIQHRRHIDPGLRYTIVRLVRYLVLTLGFLITLKQAFAVDLTSIAVIFTALSVGIGFGLQYLAADIASGFILLFERPVRVGDRITIGEDEGDVQSINLRTTVVTTNDRIAIIVPNSKLVGQRVINWSYGDPRARISIPIGVADDSDIELVTNTLLEAANDIENVLTDPPPSVQFLKFGDYSLDFRLLVWTNQPRRHVQIRSDINYRIARLFRERQIRIPYPTQEFLLRANNDNREPSLLEPEKLRDGDRTPHGS
ncbi:MAG TPA: mechanosensitive ion channel domain-containing protein [Pyrinomonadaceae bacterium]|jgi:potassium efflux system protein|nr:mechanosensitive ion channel domain-containing protein [Pyrinomonadaceae bacterium]